MNNAYQDKKGRVLFVRQHESGSWPWGTHYADGKGGFKYMVTKALPWRSSQAEAQADLDAYALQKEYETAEPVAEPETPPTPTGASDPSVAAASEGAAEAPAAAPTPSEEDVLQGEQERRLARLREELQGLVEEEMRYKDCKSRDNAHWTSLLKDVDERKADVLSEIRKEERPIPNALPFDRPAETKEAKGETDEEPMVVDCETCKGTGKDESGDDCKACMGTGKTVPPEPESSASQETPPEEEEIELSAEEMERAEKSYSADRISLGSRDCVSTGIATPFEWGGMRFCAVSTEYPAATKDFTVVEAYEIVDAQGWVPSGGSNFGPYHGIKVTYKKERLVMVGPPVRFVSKQEEAPDAT